jgi:hypothetical protein
MWMLSPAGLRRVMIARWSSARCDRRFGRGTEQQC